MSSVFLFLSNEFTFSITDVLASAFCYVARLGLFGIDCFEPVEDKTAVGLSSSDTSSVAGMFELA